MVTKHYTPTEVMQLSPIIPVIAINDASESLNLARALMDGGIKVLEITLRTPAALKAIESIALYDGGAVVGAGTVLSIDDLKRVRDAGAKFAISPGSTPALLEAAKKMEFTLLPGVATASEIMLGLELGYDRFKLFPAVTAGGIGALKSFAGPFQSVKFCPTGGVNPSNVNDFLSLSNVLCVGGTWVAPQKLIDTRHYDEITAITQASLKALHT